MKVSIYGIRGRDPNTRIDVARQSRRGQKVCSNCACLLVDGLRMARRKIIGCATTIVAKGRKTSD